ncbi:MAG: FecR domain-containing protein [Calditrichaceae bacterium]|nr:FecR domain-containing protein [Calditrichaceae bacterium]
MKKKNKYILYIMKDLTDEITPDDKQSLNAWFKADSNNQKQYDLIANIVREGRRMDFPADPDLNHEWNAFEFPEDSVPERKTSNNWNSKLTGRLVTFRRPIRLAYVVLGIFIIIASIVWYYQNMQGIETITTANCQYKEFKLPDGSMVYLNSGTKLTYPKKFTDINRQVGLSGEAFFDVVKSKDKFIVQTSEGTITVLGTCFNIRSRNKQTRVIVEEGLVRFSANDTTDNVILSKNYMSEIYDNHPPSKPQLINAKEWLGWRSGKLVFKRATLSEVSGEIGRYYDIEISIQDPSLMTMTITAVFDRLPLNKVLYSLCSTLDIQYRYENGNYILYK